MENRQCGRGREERRTHPIFIIGPKATCTPLPLCSLPINSPLIQSNVRFHFAAALSAVGNAATKLAKRRFAIVIRHRGVHNGSNVRNTNGFGSVKYHQTPNIESRRQKRVPSTARHKQVGLEPPRRAIPKVRTVHNDLGGYNSPMSSNIHILND